MSDNVKVAYKNHSLKVWVRFSFRHKRRKIIVYQMPMEQFEIKPIIAPIIILL